MNLQSKFGYCIFTQTLIIGQTDGQTIRLLDAPGGPFRPGHKQNMTYNNLKHCPFLLERSAGASSNRIVRPSVCLSVISSRVQITVHLKFG